MKETTGRKITSKAQNKDAYSVNNNLFQETKPNQYNTSKNHEIQTV